MTHAQQLMLRQEEYCHSQMQSLQPMLFKRYLPDNPIKLEKTNKQTNKNNTPTFSSFFFFSQLLVKDTIKAGPGYLKRISFMAKNVTWVLTNLM